LKHRQVYLNLADEDMDQLVSFFNKPYWCKLILKYGDLDYHSKLAGRLADLPHWVRHFIKNGFNFMADSSGFLNLTK
jgi:digeranylgeranylglycerophospholipid reductase